MSVKKKDSSDYMDIIKNKYKKSWQKTGNKIITEEVSNRRKIVIYAARDIHGNIAYLSDFMFFAKKNADIIDIGGDFTDFGDIEIQSRVLAYIRENTESRYAVITGGNHDIIEHEIMREEKGGDMESVSDLKLLNSNVVDIKPVSVYDFNSEFYIIALSGSNKINGSFPSEFDEETLKKNLESAYSSIPDGKPFILSCHVPPQNIFDYVGSAGIHAGSAVIQKFILRRNPFLVISGHIHESSGAAQYEIDGSKLRKVEVDNDFVTGKNSVVIVNTGALSEGKYCVIELEQVEYNVFHVRVNFFKPGKTSLVGMAVRKFIKLLRRKRRYSING